MSGGTTPTGVDATNFVEATDEQVQQGLALLFAVQDGTQNTAKPQGLTVSPQQIVPLATPQFATPETLPPGSQVTLTKNSDGTYTLGVPSGPAPVFQTTAPALPPGSPVTVTTNPDGTLLLGVPQGEPSTVPGPPGPPGEASTVPGPVGPPGQNAIAGTPRGLYNAASNTPTLSANGGGGAVGDTYTVSVAGTMTIDGVGALVVGNRIQCVSISQGVNQWQPILTTQGAGAFTDLAATGTATIATLSTTGAATLATVAVTGTASLSTGHASIEMNSPQLRINERDAYPIEPIVQTKDDNSLIGATPDGGIQVGGLTLIADPPYRDALPFPFSLGGGNFKALLWWDLDGNTSMSLGTALLPAIPQPYRDFAPALQNQYTSADDLISGYEDDGSFTFVPSQATLRNFGTQGYIYPATVSAAYEVFNVRRGPLKGTTIASVNSPNKLDGNVYDVLLNRNGHGTLLNVAKSTTALFPIWVYQGQSNAGAGGVYHAAGAYASGNAFFPFHSMTNPGSAQAYGNALIAQQTVTDWATYTDPSNATNPLYALTSTLISVEQFMRDDKIVSTGRYGRTFWYGGEPIDQFVKGTDNYQNVLADAQSCVRIAPSYDRTPYCEVIVWIQGENTSSLPYATTLQTLITDQNTDLATIYPNSNSGITPLWMIVQISSDGTSEPIYVNGNRQAQLQVAQGGGQYVIMPGPMYYGPLEYNSPHYLEIGRVMVGEMVSEAYMAWKKYGAFNPLWPLLTGSVTVTGSNTYTVKFQIPPDGGPLEWDTDWIGAADGIVVPGGKSGAIANYGFVHTDSASNTIASVVITEADTITVTTTGPLPNDSSRQISYAMGTATTVVAPNVMSWSTTRGQLRSPTARVSAGYRAGYAIPRLVKHYAVGFQLAF